MEESFPGKENNSPTRVNFGERLHEKKVDPSAQANSAKSSSDYRALNKLTQLGKPTWF